MSENDTKPAEQESTTTDDSATDEPLGEGGKRALDAEREANKSLKKELHDALAKISAFEDAQRTDEEKQQHRIKQLEEQLTAAQAERQAIEHRLLANEVAAEFNLPATLSGRLQGETREELVADARALAEMVNLNGPRKPAPVPEAGRVGNANQSSEQTFSDFFSTNFQ